MPIERKTFILGVGAQKCGTSWLHHQLNQLPEVEMGFCKEYRALRDTNWLKQLHKRLNQEARQAAFTKEQFLGLDDPSKHDLILKHESYYYRYFQWLLEVNPDSHTTGDISPHYSSLSSRTFRRARHHLRAQGFQVKVVFLMRDPVERVWSQLRMLRKNRKMTSVCDYPSEETALAMHYRHPRFSSKTQYHITLNNLFKAFPREEIYIDFYERLFTPDGLSKVSCFLNLNLQEANIDKHINASAKIAPICSALQREIALEYRDVYTEIHDQFGDALLDLWPNMHLAIKS